LIQFHYVKDKKTHNLSIFKLLSRN